LFINVASAPPQPGKAKDLHSFPTKDWTDRAEIGQNRAANFPSLSAGFEKI
jgi:hypothetical protein